ncbi:alcohol dehydrogenase [Marasmius fiardii PR-910]|nr:alcohol dehydrogenase [Marasmius fiardii PR-910]
MSPIRNGRLVLKEIPTGYPEPGKTFVYEENAAIDLDNVPLNGKVLVKTLALSVDPYLRSKMRDPKEPSYQEAFVLGEPLYSLGIGKVIRSENKDYKPGDYILGVLNFEEYTIPNALLRVIIPEPGLSLTAYIGSAGMPGQTAYYAWKEYSQAKKGETLFISGGAGAVGQMVIQLAKLEGLKVIASAGTEDKVKECKEAGADVAFNYKTTDTEAILKEHGPLNLYWDNVGGPTLDAALGATAHHARIIVSGMISEYNNKNGTNLKNLWTVFGRSLHIHGFLVFDLAPKWEKEFYEIVPKMLARGELKYREDITKGLEHSGEAILEVQQGKNFGKKVVLVVEDL